MAVDGSHIYWANLEAGTIDEAPLTGGTATTLVTGQDNPEGLAVDSSHIYWANLCRMRILTRTAARSMRYR